VKNKEKKEKKEKKARAKRERLKGFINEFKTFISRGNVMDLAVGVIVGAAFTAIVNSLVGDIVTPLLGLIIGGIDFSGLVVTIPGIFAGQSVTITYGNFIQSIISFLAVAFCVFLIIKVINKIKDSLIKKEQVEEKKTTPDEQQVALLEEIKELLKQLTAVDN